MRVLDLIVKKRDGQALKLEEIDFLVQEYVKGSIPDYQMSAFLMAAYLRGLNFEETKALTWAMIRSGEVLNLADIPGVKVDKHSTGGVGDKTTLVLVPLVAAAGAKVMKMSGRSLGHTGGTVDKLEAIPGFRVSFTPEEMKGVVLRTGAVLAGQTEGIVPADKKIYALRDVTGTVDCLPLIASSVMSKKIAGGADRVVLDVKVGPGGFLSDLQQARRLAELMAELGKEFRMKTVVLLTSMVQPLGRAVGNALEVEEAVMTLQGKGPQDLTELCLALGGEMLAAAEVVATPMDGRRKLESLLKSGAGLAKFRELIAAQGGSQEVVDDPSLLPRARRLIEVKASESGFIREVNAREIGVAVLLLGGGRLHKDDTIDPAVGVVMEKKVGDYVHAGEPLAVLHVDDESNLPEVQERVAQSFLIGEEKPSLPPLIYELIS
ncbi:pyrimidine-nucleoside phosphorylase Pdp [Thermacetogenium phaeum DSM 12270]|uniref:Pyrimidine-nucleoside phosphorylase n=1 Tax=Thermacetogenium phaeum (strain ATCC BAA-254 / DSM 26808 / PB) TaxID=1089553 RepID=K4LFN8_THEPS|nr:thymidine phosphorylase [Thermacetogenium phaeum]AFV11811.1 pyrimidine-nucleoside phosphorylase Pdp [Thermacetogenium phaeum DSM 12270]